MCMLFPAVFLENGEKRMRFIVGAPEKMGDPWVSIKVWLLP